MGVARSGRQGLAARLRQQAENRLPALTRLRRHETLPITLDRRRIYILPTGFGLLFAVILLVMLLGALNYNNNAALLLTCLLAATGIVSMLQTFANLDGLQLRALHTGTASAGEMLPLRLEWRAGGRSHQALELRCNGASWPFSVTADSQVQCQIPTRKRGWMTLPALQLVTRWPFGWFRAWSWLAPDRRVLVYPRAEPHGPPPPPAASQGPARQRPLGEEWSGLREYRTGDPRRHIAWKASARAADLRVRTFAQDAAEQPQRLDWQHTGLAEPEARIARLTRWVHQAHADGRTWSLHLPAETIGPGRGRAHHQHCLRALAELP